jgi:DNA polymerase
MFWVDFETRSPVDLITRGVYAYVTQAEVICMSYAFDDEEVRTWRPGEPFPDIGRAQIRAHNAAFERLVFWHVLDMPIPLERFYCTAAQARANCMPGSLEDVGRFSGAAMKKDHRGAALVRKFCIPPYSEDDPAELIEYCEQDVRAMRAVSQAMRQLTPEELADYHVSERINDRGVRLDVELALAAIKYADVEGVEIQRRVSEVTNQEVVSVRSPKMREWVLARVTPEQRELMIVKDKWSIDKSVRANLLACDDLAPEVREVVQSADDLWASSVAKFARLAALADQHDRRVRGAFVFAGGAATGRFASYGAQVHNFTRKVAKDPEAVRHAMVRGHALVPTYGARVTDVLRGMLRPALLPAEGHVFIVADWSSIEARVTPWLAGVTGEAKLDVFRSGRDPYIVNAAGAFRVPYEEVTDAQRQLGKVMELSCGFAGGAGAFAAMGRAYGTVLPEAEAKRMVAAWRRVNAWAPPFWTALEQAYLRAMRNPGHEFDAGRVTYFFDGQHLWYMLPSGRVLCYPFARLEEDGVSYAKASWKPKADAVEWPRGRLWCGLAAENCTQAVAADILRAALRRLPDVVLHVHDEIVQEVPTGRADRQALVDVMTTPPQWATGLPLACSAKVMTRYGK